ncbi:carboxypeptidase regulatory-like domain-containing protein [Longimicrobium sp.]|jgi:hypothetical protein|uniref:carboxypeptidase regulatory-like domain-containing protein n=1 Tax=Longimicrobium sp. TaxID=2029185 RepID=UPI002ED7B99F
MRRLTLVLACAATMLPGALAAQTRSAPARAERSTQLEAIRVGPPDRGCVVNPRTGLRTAAVWEAARQVLMETQAAEARGGLFTIRRFHRELDRSTAFVRSAREDSTTERRVTPFRSLPAAELARNGYVRREGNDHVFIAPDATVLLSEEFLDGHCFRVVPGRRAEAGLVGLEFEPVRGRRLPDVSGTLWLDPASADLRSMEFAYTGLPGYAYDEGEVWGGRMEFARTAAGAWMVNRWTLRLPSMGVPTGLYARGMGGGRLRVAVFSEIGGEVLRADGSERAAAPAGVVAGVVFDSAQGAPLPGATVALVGTPYSAHTDSAGAFRIAGVPAGRYEVAFTHPRVDSVGRRVAAVPVQVGASGESRVSLALPAIPASAQVATRRSVQSDTVQLAEVVVTAEARDRNLEGRGFYERERRGMGVHWSGDEFRANGRGRITDHISGTRRIFARPVRDGDFAFVQSNGGKECWVPVFLDGVRVPARRLNDLQRDDVVGVEIYEESDVPGEFMVAGHYAAGGGGACGAIVVWTVLAR